MANDGTELKGGRVIPLDGIQQAAPRPADLGRHGRGARRGQTEPLHDEIEGGEHGKKSRAGFIITGAFLAAGAIAAACASNSSIENDAGTDSGLDSDTITDTESDTVDTDTGTDTGTYEACSADYTGADNQASLEQDGKVLLGPIGHWMKNVNLSFGEQVAEVMFTNEEGEQVGLDGNPIEQDGISGYYLFNGIGSTLTVTMGGFEQTITFCGVYELDDGTLVAYFVTDNEDGFMDCAYVDSGSTMDMGVYTFDGDTTQTVVEQRHYHGFIPDPETGQDEECPGSTYHLMWEKSTFEEPIDVGSVSEIGVPGNPVMLRGIAYSFVEALEDDAGVFVKIAENESADTLSPFGSIALGAFEAIWTVDEGSGETLFSYTYPGATYIAEEDISSSEKLIRVWVGLEVKEFVLRFAQATDEETGEPRLKATLLSGVQELRNGGQVTVNGALYNVSIDTVYVGTQVRQWYLYPVAETEEA